MSKNFECGHIISVNSSTITSDLDHLQNYFESKPLFNYDEEDDNGLW